jgi:hypothetical protein
VVEILVGLTSGLNPLKGGSQMNRRMILAMLGLIGWAATANTAFAVIVIDGVVDAEYGTPLAVQDTPTRFGNNTNEMNAAYAKRDANGDVALMITGNNKNTLTGDGADGFVIFVDSRAGGAVATVREDNYGILGSFGGSFTDDWGTDTDGGENIAATPGGGRTSRS